MADLGYTTLGSLASWKDEDVRGCEFTAPSDGTIESIFIYINNGYGSGEKLKGILYDYSGNVIAETNETTGPQAKGWLEHTFSSPVAVTSGTQYLIGAFSDGAINFLYDNTTGLRSPVTNENNVYPTVKDPAGTVESYQFTMYAVFTASGGGGGGSRRPMLIT